MPTRMVRDNKINERISFRAYPSSQQSVPSITTTKINFATESWDIGGYYNTSTSEFTPPKGKYLVTVSIASNSTISYATIFYIHLYKDSSIYRSGWDMHSPGTTDTQKTKVFSCIVDANGSNVFTARLFHQVGANALLSSLSAKTFFQAIQL